MFRASPMMLGDMMRPLRIVATLAIILGSSNVILAAGVTSDPDFFWLPPTVATEPTPTGPFDATALDSLTVEVCELDAAGECVAGPPIARFTATGTPMPSRITVDQAGEFYTVDWLTGPSHVDRDRFYRVRVFKSGIELGTIDVDFAQNTPELASVDVTRYVGIVRGQQLTIRFRIQHPTARTRVKVNEIESNGGVPGDWAELHNSAGVPVRLAGYIVKDNDDTHVHVLPAGAMIPAHGHYVVEEAALDFGLGANDSVRLFTPDGATLVDSHTWIGHAVTTYGRCPDGTGAFQTNTTVTKGAANDCSIVIRVNEVESSGGTPGDWVELFNPGPGPVNLAGFTFRDNDDTHNYMLPAGTTVAPGAYLLVEEAALGFGLGGADAVRLFDSGGTLYESFSWESHATTTYGRCPNGTGAFDTTTNPTKGEANACGGGGPGPQPWPGDAAVQTADGLNVFGGNMSGLAYEGSGSATPGVLWGARNGPGALFRLVWDNVNAIWTPDAANNWSAGKALRYPDGTGSPDAEGVTFAGPSTAGGVYVSTERNNDANGISRNSILRFDPASAGATLTATHEWNLTADLPAVGPNLGMEAITWIPDAFLVSVGFVDETGGPTNPYNPANYPNHGTGLFFVGLEANGTIYAYALDHVGGGFTRVATIASGFPGVMDLHFDREQNNLWTVCDDTCQGRSAVLRAGVGTGLFEVTHQFDRPAGMPNLNNEGFTFTPLTECVGDRRPAFWADDSETGGHAIRRGTVTCAPF